MAVTSLDEPAKSVDSSALLVYVETLFGLEQLWNGTSRTRVILEIQVTHQIMRIEIELFNAEWSGNFTLVIHLLGIKQLLLRVVLQDITGGWVLQITTDVGCLSCLVTVVALTILEHNDVATVVSVELSQNVIHIERPVVCIGWHLNWMGRFCKVLNQLLRHHNFSLKGLVLFFKFLFADSFLGHLSAGFNSTGLLFKSLALCLLPGSFLCSSNTSLFSLESFSFLPKLLLFLEFFSLFQEFTPS